MICLFIYFLSINKLIEGEDFDYGNSIGVSSGFVFGTKSSFRFHDKAKNTKQSLNEVERIASMKRQAAHRAKLKLTQVITLTYNLIYYLLFFNLLFFNLIYNLFNLVKIINIIFFK